MSNMEDGRKKQHWGEKQHFSNEENFKKKNLLLIVSEEWTSISMKQEQDTIEQEYSEN